MKIMSAPHLTSRLKNRVNRTIKAETPPGSGVLCERPRGGLPPPALTELARDLAPVTHTGKFWRVGGI
jgi:hypothetical protein